MARALRDSSSRACVVHFILTSRAAAFLRSSNSGSATPCCRRAAQHKSRHVLHRHVELVGKEEARARTVRTPAMPTTICFGRPHALERPDHGVERIRDADHKSAPVHILSCRRRPTAMTFRFNAEKVVSAHARFDRSQRSRCGHWHPRSRHMNRSSDGHFEPSTAAPPVKHLAFLDAFFRRSRTTRHHQFLRPGSMGKGPTDLAGSSRSDPGTRHVRRTSDLQGGESRDAS